MDTAQLKALIQTELSKLNDEVSTEVDRSLSDAKTAEEFHYASGRRYQMRQASKKICDILDSVS